MKVSSLLKKSPEELEAMSDQEIEAHYASVLNVCRPTQIIGQRKEKADSVKRTSNKKYAAIAKLKALGITDMDEYL